ncbi:MAG: hypothetical protein ABL956_17685 [Hyphomonadaceae bacterium]
MAIDFLIGNVSHVSKPNDQGELLSVIGHALGSEQGGIATQSSEVADADAGFDDLIADLGWMTGGQPPARRERIRRDLLLNPLENAETAPRHGTWRLG